MKLSELKQGDKIKHFVFGNIVEATVIKVKPNGVETKHDPVRCGRDEFTDGYVIVSTSLQYPISQTTPGAFTMDGTKITVE